MAKQTQDDAANETRLKEQRMEDPRKEPNVHQLSKLLKQVSEQFPQHDNEGK